MANENYEMAKSWIVGAFDSGEELQRDLDAVRLQIQSMAGELKKAMTAVNLAQLGYLGKLEEAASRGAFDTTQYKIAGASAILAFEKIRRTMR